MSEKWGQEMRKTIFSHEYIEDIGSESTKITFIARLFENFEKQTENSVRIIQFAQPSQLFNLIYFCFLSKKISPFFFSQ